MVIPSSQVESTGLNALPRIPLNTVYELSEASPFTPASPESMVGGVLLLRSSILVSVPSNPPYIFTLLANSSKEEVRSVGCGRYVPLFNQISSLKSAKVKALFASVYASAQVVPLLAPVASPSTYMILACTAISVKAPRSVSTVFFHCV